MNLAATMTLNAAGFLSPLGAVRGMLGGVIGQLAAVTGVTLGVAGAVNVMRKAINEAADMEQLEVSFTVLIGSATRAKAVIADLVTFAAKTPFELKDIGPAAKQLLAFGVGTRDLIPNITRLGDVASALKIPLNELVEVYGRNLVQGRLFSRDIYQFQGRGIPIIAELAKQFGVAEGEVMGLAEAGKISSRNMEEAFVTMTSQGGRFFGMMDKQSQTFAGKLSTVRDGIAAVYRSFGAPVIDALKPMLDKSTTFLAGMEEKARSVGVFVSMVLTSIGDGTWREVLADSFLIAVGKGGNALLGVMTGAGPVLNTVLDTVFSSSFFAGLASAFAGVAAGFGVELINATGGKFLMSLRTGIADALDIPNNMRGKRSAQEARAAVADEEKRTGSKLSESRIDEIFRRSQSRNNYVTPEQRLEENMKDWNAGVKTILGSAKETTEKGAKELGAALAAAGAQLKGIKFEYKASDFFDQLMGGARARIAERMTEAMGKANRGRNLPDDSANEFATKPTAGLSGSGVGKSREIEADRLAKIGGFIGGSGGPSLDYARRTATATEKVATGIRELINKLPIDTRPTVAAFA